MAQYFTDFSEYTVGQAPADWVDVAGNITTLTIVSKTGLTGGKALRIENSTFDNTDRAARWSAVPSKADTEVLVKVRFPSDGYGGSHGLFLFARVASADPKSGYYNQQRANLGGTNQIYDPLGNNLASIDTNLDPAVGWPDRTLFAWMRFRVNGTALKSKFWLDGDPEPTSWLLETTDSTVTIAGYSGVGLIARRTTLEVDVYSVGTDGDPAPTGPISAVATPTSLGTTNLLATSARLTWSAG